MSFLLKKTDPSPSDITKGSSNRNCKSATLSGGSGATLDDPQNNVDNDKKIKLLLNAILSGRSFNNCEDDDDDEEDEDCGGDNEKNNLLCGDDDSSSSGADNNEVPKKNLIIEHKDGVFCFACNCEHCINYRTTVIELLYEDFEFNTLWDRLQLLIRKYYDIIPEDDNSVAEKKYKSLMSKNVTKWLSDGRVRNNKNIQLSLGSNLPLSNEMTFILVFSMLYTRDPHQLFELLCIQLRSIVVAYSEELQNLIKFSDDTPDYNPSDLLNYILDGYDKICKSAKNLSPLLFELQRDHLQQFSLTWNLLNQRMYQKWVYLEVQKLIPECIIKLKELVYSEKYKSMVFRFIKFDDEMTKTTQTWREVWSLLHDYNLSRKELERRKRISNVGLLLKKIKASQLTVLDDVDDGPLTIQQSINMERQEFRVWQTVYNFIRNKWIESTDTRLSMEISNMQCLKCKNALASHYMNCKCRTCLIAGGPDFTKLKENLIQFYCSKCSIYETIDREYINYVTRNIKINFEFDATKAVELGGAQGSVAPSGAAAASLPLPPPPTDETPKTNLISKQDVYHLSWAVFKRLPDRVPYAKRSVKDFCIFQIPPCTNIPCKVASHIVAAIYPINFSKLLIGAYQPVDHETRKDPNLTPIQNLDMSYFLHKLHEDIKNTIKGKEIDVDGKLLDDVDMLTTICSYKDDIYLLRDMASLFAESCLTNFQFTADDKIFPCFLSLFKISDNDIDIDLNRLDCIYASRLLLPMLKNGNATKSTTDSGNSSSGKKGEVQEYKMTCCKSEQSKKSGMPDLNMKFEKMHLENRPNLDHYEKTANGEIIIRLEDIIKKDDVERKEKNKLLKEDARKPKDNLQRNSHGFVTTPRHNLKAKSTSQLLKESTSTECQHKEEESGARGNKENASKTCHRNDGQSVCYCCTIFGYTICNHGRTNGTRDRLRKRLTQNHNNKESNKPLNLKTLKTSDLLKTINTTKTATHNGKNAKEVEEIKKTVNPVLVEKIDQFKEASNAKKLAAQKLATQKPKTAFPEPEKVTPPPIVPIKSNTTNISTPSPVTTTPLCATSKTSRSESVTSSIGLTSVNDLLQFIEGSSLAKSRDPHKKAAKKAKQKQKKEDLKRVGELEDMRTEFHEYFVKEMELKKEIRILRAAKKKDKKRISEIESKIKRTEKDKSRKETSIKDIIEQIQGTTPEFIFDYSYKVEAPLPKVAAATKTKAEVNTENTLHAQYVAGMNATKQFMPILQANRQSSVNFEATTDPAKRMVTIRRVNLPHAEPQVTVTAKGPSPDRDMLLYTFVNGQLVPAHQAKNQQAAAAAAANNATSKIIRPTPMQASSVKAQQQSQQQLPIAKINKKMTVEQTVTPIPKVNTKTAKTQVAEPSTKRKSSLEINKKNDTTKAVLTAVAKKNEEKIAEVKPTKSDKKSKKSKEIEKDVVVVEESSKSQVKAKDRKKSAIVDTETSTPVTSAKQQKLKSKAVKLEAKAATAAAAPIVLSQPTPPPIPSTPTKIEKRTQKVPYEYCEAMLQRNPFELLDDDSSDTESIYEEISESPPPPPPPIKEKPVQQPERKNSATLTKNQQKSKNKATSQEQVTSKSNAKTAEHPLSSSSQPTAKSNKKSKNKEVIVAVARTPTPPPSVEDVPMSKKQKKKLKQAQKMQQTDATESLVNSMQKMHLNYDTTIELIKNAEKYNYGTQMNNISIMEQLKRGVNVEGLKLPPGITLTRVDPNSAEAVKAKKESIAKITQPMQPPVDQPMPPQMMMANPQMMHNTAMLQSMNLGPDPNGVIMIDTMNIKKSAEQNGASASAANQKKSKKNKRKGKNAEVAEKQQHATANHHGKNDKSTVSAAQMQQQPKMVTLRNPMFHAVSSAIRQNQVPLNNVPPAAAPPSNGMDQPAAIIKNENGMFTIRNPALHQAMQSGVVNNFRQYGSAPGGGFGSPEQAPQPENFSYFSDSSPNIPITAKKSCSAIGSEMKSAQQQKQQQQHQQQQQQQQQQKPMPWPDTVPQNGDVYSHLNYNDTPPLHHRQSPFENQCVYGLNSNFIIPSTSPGLGPIGSGSGGGATTLSTASLLQPSMSSSFYDNMSNGAGAGGGGGATGGFSSSFAHNNDCNSLFSSNRCSETNSSASSTPSTTQQHQFYDGVCNGVIGQSAAGSSVVGSGGIGSSQHKYDDLSFLQNLQPGHRLNSEVTIHNINESKFLRAQQAAQLPNGVEITKIHGPSASSSSSGSMLNGPNLAVGSNRATTKLFAPLQQQHTSKSCDHLQNEFGDNIFAPNQAVNLNELESEERDIESFKRFNYYFEPPKNKPKINLNIKDIVVNKMPTPVSASAMQSHSGHECTSPLPQQLQQHLHHQNSQQQQHQHLHEECGGGDTFSTASSAYNKNQAFIDFLKSSNFRNNFSLNNGTIGSDIKYKYDNIVE